MSENTGREQGQRSEAGQRSHHDETDGSEQKGQQHQTEPPVENGVQGYRSVQDNHFWYLSNSP
jgi:hypothetical protein